MIDNESSPFMDREDILERYQEHYPYILVDEYQDTNPVQYKLCKLLASKMRNIFVVGDMNQSIYIEIISTNNFTRNTFI